MPTKIIVSTLLLTFHINSYAAVSYMDIIMNLEDTIDPIKKLILTACWVTGIFCILKSLFMFKQFGMHISQLSGNREIGGPIGLFAVGIMFLYIPDISNITSNTLFSNTTCSSAIDFSCKTNSSSVSSIISYSSVNNEWNNFMVVIIKFINLIGLISMMRGLGMVSKAGNPGVQEGTVKKGTVHIIGGTIALNFITITKILQNTLFY